MLDISRKLPTRVTFEGCTYRLDLSFDRVLRVLEFYREDTDDYTKARFALAMLVRHRAPPMRLLQVIFEQFITQQERKTGRTEMRTVDFLQDSPYIYASFLSDYNINLIQAQGKLHWWEFLSLFQGLTESSKMREVIAIRSRPIPERTKHNAKEIQALMDAKAFYALKMSQEESEAQFCASLERLAGALRSRAE